MKVIHGTPEKLIEVVEEAKKEHGEKLVIGYNDERYGVCEVHESFIEMLEDGRVMLVFK